MAVGRGAEQRWAPVPVGTWHCMALPTFGAFCIIKDFAALAAVLLEQSFFEAFSTAEAWAEPSYGANTDSCSPMYVSNSFS